MKQRVISLLASFLVLVTCFITPTKAEQVQQEAFVIDFYELELTVSEEGLIDVRQSLDVTFSEERHGIYLDIPTQYVMNWNIDGKEVRRTYRFPVSNIRVENHPYSVDSYSEGQRIRIGDADKYVNGKVEYDVSYRIKTADLDLNGKQMLYYNLIAPAWNTTIKAASFIIHMPKTFDRNNVYFYFGEYGSNLDSMPGFTYDVVGTTIYANLSTPLNPMEGVTLQIDVPNEYFNYPKPIDFTGFVIVISIVLALMTVVLFFRYGKDDVVIKTVEFRAPEGLTCASMSYVLNGDVSANDVICLIIEWANLGYLSLEEVGSDNMRLIKEKDMGEERTRYERRMFNALFKNGNETETKDLEQSFYATIQATVDGIKSYHTKSKKRRVFTQSSLVIQGFSLLLAVIPTCLGMMISFQKIMYSGFLAIVVSLLIGILGVIAIALISDAIQKRISRSKGKTVAMIAGGLVLALIYFVIYSVVVMAGNGSEILVLSGITATVLISVCAFFMDKRTEQGLHWYGQILGLKDFILTAEKSRLEALVNDDPQYFYHILPYAYVLGVSDVWSKKFADIVMENARWYRNEEPVPVMMFMPRFYRSMSTLRQLNTIPPVTESKGGGTFTSGGSGGGFSGGGFGGGGGGSW